MTTDISTKQRIWRYRIFAITWLAYAGFYLCRKNFSVVMPLLTEELGFSNTDFARVIFLYGLFYALGQFYNGFLSDRFGPRLIVTIGLVISIVANVLMGFGTTLMMFLILMCANGAGQSSGWSGTVKNMATWFRRTERGVVMGWWGTCYVLGGVIASAFATFVAVDLPLFPSLGWRRAFWAPAILLTIVGIGYALLTRNKPADAGLPPVDEEEEDREPSPGGGSGVPETTSKEIAFRILKNPVVWTLSIMYFFLKMTRYAFIFWLPKYMVERLGYAPGEAGYTSVLYELVGFTGAIMAGYASDKLFQSRRMPVGALMLFGLAIACFFHPRLAAQGRLGNAIGIAIIGIMTYGPDSLMAAAGATDAGSQRAAGFAVGFMNGVGSFGQMLSGYLVAYAADNYGWDSMFYCFTLFAAIGGCLLALRWNWVPPTATQQASPER